MAGPLSAPRARKGRDRRREKFKRNGRRRSNGFAAPKGEQQPSEDTVGKPPAWLGRGPGRKEVLEVVERRRSLMWRMTAGGKNRKGQRLVPRPSGTAPGETATPRR